jgi:DDE family transposase
VPLDATGVASPPAPGVPLLLCAHAVIRVTRSDRGGPLALHGRRRANVATSADSFERDAIVDAIDSFWRDNAKRYGRIDRLVIDLDNGPENHSRRTRFVQRMVQFVDAQDIQVQLAYYPPYHSKYNPVQRVWGALENAWNGDLLDTIPAALHHVDPDAAPDADPDATRECRRRTHRMSGEPVGGGARNGRHRRGGGGCRRAIVPTPPSHGAPNSLEAPNCSKCLPDLHPDNAGCISPIACPHMTAGFRRADRATTRRAAACPQAIHFASQALSHATPRRQSP